MPVLEEADSARLASEALCQACGACCSVSPDWPRFSTEDDEHLESIPGRMVAGDESGMRCDGARCCALVGEVGVSTRCGIYALRPHVCHACLPGDPECQVARARFGMEPVA